MFPCEKRVFIAKGVICAILRLNFLTEEAKEIGKILV